MRSHMFKPLGCTCSTTDTMRAVLEGKAQPLCPVHQQDQIAQRDADRRRFETEAELGRQHELFRSIKDSMTAAAEPECSCPTLRDEIAGRLEGRPPKCAVHHPPAPDSSSVALNDDESLARIIGLPLARSHTPKPPLDAA